MHQQFDPSPIAPTRRGPKLKISPGMLEQAEELYATGLSGKEIAEQLGVKMHTLLRNLKRVGVKMRPRGNPTGKGVTGCSKVRPLIEADLRAQNGNLSEIAIRHGITTERVRQIAKIIGVTYRTHFVLGKAWREKLVELQLHRQKLILLRKARRKVCRDARAARIIGIIESGGRHPELKAFLGVSNVAASISYYRRMGYAIPRLCEGQYHHTHATPCTSPLQAFPPIPRRLVCSSPAG